MAELDEKELEDLLEDTLGEFSDEVAAHPGAADAGASVEEAAAAAAKRKEASKEAVRAEVCGKFTALMAIFSTDVRLQGEHQKEFQALADQQLELLKKAVDAGQCTTGLDIDDDDALGSDPLARAVKDTVDMLRAQGGEAGGGGAGDEELLSKLSEQLSGFDADPKMHGVMEDMMTQLLSKEFLYEPLSEIATKYPDWLTKHGPSLSEEDRSRYTRQLAVIREICDTYDKEPDNTDKVVELMQRMQECGQPPPEIVKDLGGGVELDEKGMPKGLPGDCCIM
eukprot:Tamp_17434.p1 GENE.Tamp_17434~~Tamp_17434.p1  ORF type:complete len:281 (+),score=78.25 Tamp_17434:106-948(+)